MDDTAEAPGGPGIMPRWTSSAKTGAGTALGNVSDVWFTLSHGIFNEIYYPRVDTACTRDWGFIVTDGQEFFSEEKRHTHTKISRMAEGVPAYRLENLSETGHYRIEKDVLTDPQRHVVLQRTRFKPLAEPAQAYRLYTLLAPHLGNQGAENTAWIGDFKGVPMLFAQRNGIALALASSTGWLKRSAGFVGCSDGWQDLSRHKIMSWSYARATNGNVALCGEIDWKTCDGEFLLALGFGRTANEAGLRAHLSLLDGFDAAATKYIGEWEAWQATLPALEAHECHNKSFYRNSTALLRLHESKDLPGGLIASLSIPWGFSKCDNDLGGYHLIWPRDLAESAGGLLAAGAHDDVLRVLYYLQVTQEDDGHWPQNMWLDGTHYWPGIQMDETAFPILLADLARREGLLNDNAVERLWPTLRNAAGFLVRNGPVTPQDRWEEDPGYSPFTLAAEIAALLAAADFADLRHESAAAEFLRETADVWNANVERWTYITGTPLAQKIGVEGYYVRIAPPEIAEAASPEQGFVPVKRRPVNASQATPRETISPDALALVRFGLRAPDDPRILNTLKVLDAVLKVETPNGPAWHRYNHDVYGEHGDGSPFNGSGIGRAWPLLTGERAHYELAAGHTEEAVRLLHALEAFANEGGMIPEQIWDAQDIPERELWLGAPTGSAMPLVWAHAEYVKLVRSLRDKRIFDQPAQTVQRYVLSQHDPTCMTWRLNQKCRVITAGCSLRLDLPRPATVRWSFDNWQTVQETDTRPNRLGFFVAYLQTEKLPLGTNVDFTFHWTSPPRWEGKDYRLHIGNVDEYCHCFDEVAE